MVVALTISLSNNGGVTFHCARSRIVLAVQGARSRRGRVVVSGHIKIYCEDGHGTCIKIYLPRAAGDDIKSIGAAMAVPVQGGTEAILVVEDDPLVRNYVITQLVGLGYHAIPAANAAEALVLIDQGSTCDLLFTDVIMSGSKNGRELADEVVRRRP
jgi:response regulator receiver domain-containing protein